MKTPKAPRIDHPTEIPLPEWFAQTNRTAANIILENPLRYGGGDSLMVRWARMVIYGYQPTEKNWGLVA